MLTEIKRYQRRYWRWVAVIIAVQVILDSAAILWLVYYAN